MKIIFMGTPDFAATSLHALLDWDAGSVVAVYCQPDRPAGRGHALQTGPVKALALKHGIEVLQPFNFKQQADLDKLASFNADIFVVAAYGLILPKAVLDMPPMGVINVHGSLLPEYRGAAPIQRSIMAGDFRTGITIMRVEPKLDSGPILLQRAMAIGVDQTAGELHDELAKMGGDLLIEALERMQQGRINEQVQDESLVTYADKLSKADGLLDFSMTARQVHNQARGVTPWPGAQLILERKATDGTDKALEPIRVVVEKGKVLQEEGSPVDGLCAKEISAHGMANDAHDIITLVPGDILPVCDNCLPIMCAKGIYGISRLRPAGGKSMDAAAFVNGYLKNCIAKIAR